VWLPNNSGRSWSCEQCTAKKGLRELRGNCGGPFKKGLPCLEEDEVGLYMPGYRIAPGSGENYSELKVRSCPVALANLIAPVVSSYNKHKKGILTLKDMYDNPSCAIVDAFELLDYEYESLKIFNHSQALKESSNGSK
jgi:hypothetical protein